MIFHKYASPSESLFNSYFISNPELFHLPDEESKLHAMKDSILLRDIIQRQAIKDPKLLEDLFIYLINTSSNPLNNGFESLRFMQFI